MENNNLLYDEKLSDFVSELHKQHNEICDKILSIFQGKSQIEKLFTVKKQDLPVKYKKFLNNLEGDTSIFLRQNRLIHLLKRGHITGKAFHGIDDGLPLKAEDFANLYLIFMKPNSVILHDNYLEISKWTFGKPLRLIVRFNKKFSKLDIVSFYNYAPIDVKEDFLPTKNRH